VPSFFFFSKGGLPSTKHFVYFAYRIEKLPGPLFFVLLGEISNTSKAAKFAPAVKKVAPR
jgi:hypothetical protein